jgi:HIV Tat-specific factor 1
VGKECHVRSSFWDGVTDFTARNDDQEEKDAEERHEEFGNWLDNQELPEELRLLTE